MVLVTPFVMALASLRPNASKKEEQARDPVLEGNKNKNDQNIIKQRRTYSQLFLALNWTEFFSNVD